MCLAPLWAVKRVNCISFGKMLPELVVVNFSCLLSQACSFRAVETRLSVHLVLFYFPLPVHVIRLQHPVTPTGGLEICDWFQPIVCGERGYYLLLDCASFFFF